MTTQQTMTFQPAPIDTSGIALPPDCKTLAQHFGEAGYYTGYIGKWHLADSDPVPEHQQGGYDYWLGSNLLEFTSEPYNTVMYDRQGKPVKMPGYRVDALTDATESEGSRTDE